VEQPTAVLPVASEPDAGAQAAPPVPVSPGFRDRGKLRRRLRYLRRVRELGYRDLGGLTFDLHRFGRDGAPLGEERAFVDLREAGIAACPRCAALHGSEARFCPSCGIALVGPMAGVVSASAVGVAAEPPVPPAPLWGPAGPPAEAGAAAPAPGAPAAAAVFPGPVSPVPAEQPTQSIPAGAESPPVAPRAAPASAAPAAPAPAARAEMPDGASVPEAGHPGEAAGPAEPAAVAGGTVAAPEPRAERS
jgi:hypothetical protein